MNKKTQKEKVFIQFNVMLTFLRIIFFFCLENFIGFLELYFKAPNRRNFLIWSKSYIILIFFPTNQTNSDGILLLVICLHGVVYLVNGILLILFADFEASSISWARRQYGRGVVHMLTATKRFDLKFFLI